MSISPLHMTEKGEKNKRGEGEGVEREGERREGEERGRVRRILEKE